MLKRIKIDSILVDRSRHNKYVDHSRLIESIKQKGQLSPLIVELSGRKYLLIDGLSRLFAMKKLGYEYTNVRVLPICLIGECENCKTEIFLKVFKMKRKIHCPICNEFEVQLKKERYVYQSAEVH